MRSFFRGKMNQSRIFRKDSRLSSSLLTQEECKLECTYQAGKSWDGSPVLQPGRASVAAALHGGQSRRFPATGATRTARAVGNVWHGDARASQRLKGSLTGTSRQDPVPWGQWLPSAFPRESHNHRMFGVGRDLCGSSSPTPPAAGSPTAGCTRPCPGGS